MRRFTKRSKKMGQAESYPGESQGESRRNKRRHGEEGDPQVGFVSARHALSEGGVVPPTGRRDGGGDPPSATSPLASTSASVSWRPQTERTIRSATGHQSNSQSTSMSAGPSMSISFPCFTISADDAADLLGRQRQHEPRQPGRGFAPAGSGFSQHQYEEMVPMSQGSQSYKARNAGRHAAGYQSNSQSTSMSARPLMTSTPIAFVTTHGDASHRQPEPVQPGRGCVGIGCGNQNQYEEMTKAPRRVRHAAGHQSNSQSTSMSSRPLMTSTPIAFVTTSGDASHRQTEPVQPGCGCVGIGSGNQNQYEDMTNARRAVRTATGQTSHHRKSTSMSAHPWATTSADASYHLNRQLEPSQPGCGFVSMGSGSNQNQYDEMAKAHRAIRSATGHQNNSQSTSMSARSLTFPTSADASHSLALERQLVPVQPERGYSQNEDVEMMSMSQSSQSYKKIKFEMEIDTADGNLTGKVLVADRDADETFNNALPPQVEVCTICQEQIRGIENSRCRCAYHEYFRSFSQPDGMGWSGTSTSGRTSSANAGIITFEETEDESTAMSDVD